MEMPQKISVYYDGLCKICNKEIQHYKRQVGAEKIDFIDICDDAFDAKAAGLDPYKIHKIMHVRKSDGSLATKVDAFVEIWKQLPKYRFLVPWAQSSWIRPWLNAGYEGFVIVRPFLPRNKKLNCAESPYCELPK